MGYMSSYRVNPNTIEFNHLNISGSSDSSCHYYTIVEHILNINKRITLYEIQQGIEYGWYFIECDDFMPQIVINEYNEHLWKKGCNKNFSCEQIVDWRDWDNEEDKDEQ